MRAPSIAAIGLLVLILATARGCITVSQPAALTQFEQTLYFGAPPEAGAATSPLFTEIP